MTQYDVIFSHKYNNPNTVKNVFIYSQLKTTSLCVTIYPITELDNYPKKEVTLFYCNSFVYFEEIKPFLESLKTLGLNSIYFTGSMLRKEYLDDVIYRFPYPNRGNTGFKYMDKKVVRISQEGLEKYINDDLIIRCQKYINDGYIKGVFESEIILKKIKRLHINIESEEFDIEAFKSLKTDLKCFLQAYIYLNLSYLPPVRRSGQYSI